MDVLTSDSNAERLRLPRHELQRRAARRQPYHAVVTVLGTDSARGVTINASQGGLRVAVDRALQVGEHIMLRVDHAGRPPMLQRVIVAWVRKVDDGCIAGLAFATLH